MKKEIIRHDAMPPPYAAYSQAVRAGDLLFGSGQAGIVPETGQVAGSPTTSTRTAPIWA